jgi:pimeloyl-ACP methyl ester carboxylesterase
MPATFVLLHGGSMGGWCFQRVARLLRQAGHEVYTPTLTGFGERKHLNGPDITMETHILDVANILDFEDLRDVVLAGHSLGSTVVPHVAERVPDRIRRVVWLAGMVLRDGETLMNNAPASEWTRRAVVVGPDGRPKMDYDLQMDALLQDGTAEDRAWVRARLSAAPPAALLAPGRLSTFLALDLPTGYILALQDRAVPPEVARGYVGLLPGCRYREVDAGHALMISAPEATARALLEMV